MICWGRPKASVYRNHGQDRFSFYDAGLIPVRSGAAAACDFDKDGWQDIAIIGRERAGGATRVYRNRGDGTFEDTHAGLLGVSFGSIAWGDYDSDGFPDLVVAGTGPGYATRLYHNQQGRSFAPLQSGLTDVYGGSVAWGDVNNDGRPDLLISGHDAANKELTRIYVNEAGRNFIPIEIRVTQVWLGSAAWADVDNDAHLDIVVSGGGAKPFTGIYRNIFPCDSNTVPAAPALPKAKASNDGVQLSWETGSDEETAPDGLTYNLRVGTIPSGIDVLSASSSSTGQRYLPQQGNVGWGTRCSLTNLAAGTYFWSVQSVDPGLMASPFSEESVFVVGPVRIDAFVESGDSFLLQFPGTSRSAYDVLFSTDMQSWVRRGTATEGPSGHFEFRDPIVSGAGFYRVQARE